MAQVSLTMIVRNEAANLRACLDSLRDLFHEIIVVDTGSTDNTRQLAAAMNALVVDFSWCDDFAAARNPALDRATADWIFWLDADERLDDSNRHQLRDLFHNLGSGNIAYMMQCISKTATGAATIAEHVRLFRRDPQIRWKYRIHEQIAPAILAAAVSIERTPIAIDHLGYRDATIYSKKLERNLRLLERSLREHPNDSQILAFLGQTLLAFGRVHEALPRLQKGLELSTPADPFARKLCAQLARAYNQLGRRNDALAVCRNGLQRFPDFAELAFMEGQLLAESNDLTAAEKCFQQLLAPDAAWVSGDAGLCGYKSRMTLAGIYHRQGKTAQAEEQWRHVAAEQSDNLPAWLSLVELWTAQGRDAEIENAIAQLPSDTAALLRAQRLMLQKQWPEAQRILLETTTRDPRAFWARVLLGDVHTQQGQLADAEKSWREVANLNPDYPTARKKLAHLATLRAKSS